MMPETSAVDHPRSRGVYLRVLVAQELDLGSSPLARGLQSGAGVGLGQGGIIPARAGFTACPAYRVQDWWDHPRSRGVYERVLGRVEFMPGSSPLARGLRRGNCEVCLW